MDTAFCRFPDKKKRPECRARWIHAIRRKDWKPTSNSYLCSDHFEENCFVVRPNKIGRRLNDSAVPSIFNFPPHLQPKPHTPRKARTRSAEASASSSHVSPVVEVQDAPSPEKIVRRVNVEHSYMSRDPPLSPEMVEKTEKLKKKIKILTQRVRRKQRQINKMADLLKSTGE